LSQELYYALHSVFLNSQSIFLVVFDLHEAEAGDEFLDNLAWWLNSIYSHDSDLSVRNILLIGTHKDLLQDQSAEALERINATLVNTLMYACCYPKIYDAGSRTGDCGRLFFAVDCLHAQSDPEVAALRRAIDEDVLPAHPGFRQLRPLLWLRVLEALRARAPGAESGGAAQVLTSGEALALADAVSVEMVGRPLGQARLSALLTYFHTVGELVYFADLEGRFGPGGNLVVLDPQWLALRFRQILYRLDLRRHEPPQRRRRKMK
jgi:hypothetical protein